MNSFFQVNQSALLLLCVSCAPSDDYRNDHVIQQVETHEAKFVEIVCYCPGGVDVTTSDNDRELKIEREFASVPGPGGSSFFEELTGAAPTFKFEHEGDTLRVVSEKWLYKHRSYVSEVVRVTIPRDLRYSIKNIPADEWEGKE